MLRILFFVLAMLLGQTSAFAASMFSSEVVLDDSDSATEQAAKEKAFVDVLVRASGQSTVGENQVIQKALPTVGQYITQLGYGAQDGQRTLVLGFDDAKIRTLLTQAQATYWGEPRPEVLFWVIEDTPTQRNVIWEQSGSPLIGELKAEGERRGLPVLMPVGDFDDVVAVSVPDLWGGFAEPIAKASARYNPTGIVVVKVNDRGLTWQMFPNAAAINNDTPVEGRVSGAPAQAFPQMIDAIADYYAQRLAVNLGVVNGDALSLEISDLNDAEDFFVVERSLKALNSVAALRLDSIIDDKATFKLSLLASEDIFHNEMMADRRLQRLEAQSPEIETPPVIDAPINVTESSVDTTSGTIATGTVTTGSVTTETSPIVEPPLVTSPTEAMPTVPTPHVIRYKWVG
ncbi:DUF2066 domain-containing protein [Enterovibrio nigricans]|uniref:DUF2066 domain-containing protein n=1 Tax=Enterovibrio nigricans DSM 22720 TaxID=1121868 RepID=A0A1T4UP29_9GAMM|nr:DUF2066 domain-containing protein [Enterovibrio nigricans]SKA54181.1 hypothetical protein SAMN02745132_02084 [Enterovibrio nigricans DSM 22720]